MKTFAVILALLSTVFLAHGTGSFPIEKGLLQTDLNVNGLKLTNVVDVTDANGNSLLGGGAGGGISLVQGSNIVNGAIGVIQSNGAARGTTFQFSTTGTNVINGIINTWSNAFFAIFGTAAFTASTAYDAAGAGITAATASTNGIGISSGLAAFRSTNTFAATNAATASARGLVKVDNSTITVAADGTISATTGGSGDFSGPGSSVADNFVSFNGSTGKAGKDSGKSAASFDLAGAGTTAATSATNAAGLGSGLSAYVPTNRFDVAGAATAATNTWPWMNLGSISDSMGTYSNLADVNFALPPRVAIGLTNQWYSNTKTAFLSPSGNDATAVLGNPALPSLTLTNAYTLSPTNGGCIWLLGDTMGQGLVLNKNLSFVSINHKLLMPDSGSAFNCNSNLIWWGGEADAIFSPNAAIGPVNIELHYLKIFYPGSTNVDCIYGIGSVLVDHVIANGCFDAITPHGGSLSVVGSDFIAVINAAPLPVNPARALSIAGFAGTHYISLKNSALIAFGSTNYNVALQATRNSTINLDNVLLITGTNAVSTNLFVTGANTFVNLRRMSTPVSLLTDGLATITNLNDNQFVGSVAGDISGGTNVNVSTATGTLPQAVLPSTVTTNNSTLSGILKGDGARGVTAATANVDYIAQTPVLTNQVYDTNVVVSTNNWNWPGPTNNLDFARGTLQRYHPIGTTGVNITNVLNFPASGVGSVVLWIENTNTSALNVKLPTVCETTNSLGGLTVSVNASNRLQILFEVAPLSTNALFGDQQIIK